MTPEPGRMGEDGWLTCTGCGSTWHPDGTPEHRCRSGRVSSSKANNIEPGRSPSRQEKIEQAVSDHLDDRYLDVSGRTTSSTTTPGGTMHTIAMTVIAADDTTAQLAHEVEDDERHDDGYTGASLTLFFNEAEAGIPLAVGQVVEVTVTATAEQQDVERIVTDDQGQPSHVERLNPATGEWADSSLRGDDHA